MFVHPLLVGVAALEIVVDLEAGPHLAVAGVHHEQLARADAALLQHFVRGVVPGAHFGGQGDELVLGDDVAGRAQAVAVERTGGVATIGHDDAGGAIPGLHVHGVEVVEGAQIVIHVGVLLPRRRDQQAHGPEQIHAAGEEEIQHVVETGGVGARGVDEGGGLLQIRNERGGELVAARLGPLTVASDSVDFAVVGEITEWLGQRPARAGVGGEALVEDADGRLHADVGEIQIEARQVHRHAQPFVDGDQVGEADHVEVVVVDALFDAAAHDIEAALKILVDPAGRGVDKDLFNTGQGSLGDGAEHIGIDGHLAPADQAQGLFFQLFVDDIARLLGQYGVRVQKQHADRIIAAQVPSLLFGDSSKEAVRFLQQQTAAIAGLTVGWYAAAVLHASQCWHRETDKLVAGFTFHVGQQAEATVIPLQLWII